MKEHNNSNFCTPRESFLLALLSKIVKEYKTLVEFTRRIKPLKIVEIIYLSSVPGETKFSVQFTNKNCVLYLTAAEIISGGYKLTNFNEFHAELIQQAVRGKLIEFLQLSDNEPLFKITAKKFDSNKQQYTFTIKTNKGMQFTHTAEELSKDKNLLLNMDISDIYDIGYTHGTEAILKEKTALLLAKRR